MFSKKHNETLTSSTWIAVGMLVVGMGLSPRVIQAVTLSELTAQAKKEGVLNATVTGAMKGETIAKLGPAFKKRFGLGIKVNILPTGDTRYYPKAIIATRARGMPVYDTLEGSDLNNAQLMGVGGLQKVEGWEGLLAEINPLVGSGKVKPSEISPKPFTGRAFKYLSRVKTMIYNTRNISKEGLPDTHTELGEAKFKGKFVQPPFPSHWNQALLAFPDLNKKKWLEVIRKAGKNAGAIGFPRGNVQRVLIGEYPFALANAYNRFRMKHLDPKATIGLKFFQDYTPVGYALYIVRERARHPAAGTLFAMWMGTPEAEAIWQPDIFSTQFEYGVSEVDRNVRQLLKESGAKKVSFLGSDRGVELLNWFGTDEGRQYSRAITRAIRGN